MEHAAQLLDQALVISKLDFHRVQWNLLQIIQSTEARPVFNNSKRVKSSYLSISQHWLHYKCFGYKLLNEYM